MNKILKTLLVSSLMVGVSGVVCADADRIEKAEAQTLVKKLIDYYKKNGREKAIAAGNSPEFYVKKDGYIFAYAEDGTNLIHKDEKMRGKNVIDMKDASGKFFIKEILAKCKSPGSGWVTYDWPNANWPNPVSKKVERKEMYVEAHDGLCFASGYSKTK